MFRILLFLRRASELVAQWSVIEEAVVAAVDLSNVSTALSKTRRIDTKRKTQNKPRHWRNHQYLRSKHVKKKHVKNKYTLTGS